MIARQGEHTADASSAASSRKCPLSLTTNAAAEALGVTRKTLNDLVNGHSGVSPEMALRLEQVFGNTTYTWLEIQTAYVLARARSRVETIKVTRRFVAPMPAWKRFSKMQGFENAKRDHSICS